MHVRARVRACVRARACVCVGMVCYLLVAGDATVDGSVDDSVERHAEQVDVPVQLLVLVLTDQSPQLLVLVLHHVDGILQRTHLHLGGGTHGAVRGTRYACSNTIL